MVNSVLDKARSYAYRLLNYRPRSEQEIRYKLKEKGFAEEAIDSLVLELKNRFFIDDYDFAKLWARSRLQSSGQGFSNIRRELVIKGIAEDIIENVMTMLEDDFDEYDMAKGLIKTRFRPVPGINKGREQHRLYAYLKRRGFSNNIIYKVINETYADTK
ncbi:MAG: regulatory protein RecX [Dehalococcoidia bacterium]|nr:MAG: regulatory protein RecX [Dehalococcoidia bacterium]